MNQPDIKDIKISVPKIGDEIDCTFSRKDKEFIYVEFGYKSEGRINIGEFTDEEIKILNTSNKIRAEFKDESFSFPMLSTLNIRRNLEKESINKKFKNNEPIDAKFIAKKNDHILVNLGEKDFIKGKIPRTEMNDESFNKFYRKNQIIKSEIITFESEYILSVNKLKNNHKQKFLEYIKNNDTKEISAKITEIKDSKIVINFMDLELEVDRENITYSNKKNLNNIFKKNSIHIFNLVKSTHQNEIINLQISSLKNQWPELINAKNNKIELSGKIIAVKEFGIFIEYNKIFDIYIPSKECSWKKYKTKDFTVNDFINFNITSVNEREKNILGSIKNCIPSDEEIFYYANRNEKISVKFTKDIGKDYIGKSSQGLNVIINKYDISWNNGQDSLNLNELYECKIIKISNRKDTLRVSIKDLKKNPWLTFKDKFKINSILEDLDILEVENENIIIDSYQGCKALFPIKLVSENAIENLKKSNKISGIVDKFDDMKNLIFLNNIKYEKRLEKKQIKNFNKSQGEYNSKLGDIFKDKIKIL